MVKLKGKVMGLDTNVFVYFFGEHLDFGKQSQRIFELLSENKAKAVTSVLTLTELLSFDADERSLHSLQAHVLETPNLVWVPIDQQICVKAAEIRRRYKFRTPDAIALATSVIERVDVFVTNDLRLHTFKECKVVGL